MPTFPIDVDRAALTQDLRAQISDIARTTHPDVPLRLTGTAGGDERRLRGIPAIGRGVTGAMNGTSPHHVK